MKRLPLVLFALSSAIVTTGSAMLAAPGQNPAQAPNEPGRPTTARMFVLNKARPEAIPVTIQEVALAPDAPPSPPLRVAVVGAVQLNADAVVTLGPRSVTEAHAGRQVWDYREITVMANQSPAAMLASAGLEGWEVTGATLPVAGGTMLILKRPR